MSDRIRRLYSTRLDLSSRFHPTVLPWNNKEVTPRPYSYYIHITGHGIGLRYHDPIPILMPGSVEVLQEGMVSIIEPGVYIKDWGGIELRITCLSASTDLCSSLPFANPGKGITRQIHEKGE